MIYPKIKVFELILSNACNLKCKYCFVKQTSICMTEDDIDKALNFINNYPNKDKDYTIHLFGGEALLQEHLIKYFLLHNNNQQGVLIFTNVTLLTEEFLTFTHSFDNVQFNFSLDGIQVAHDINRLYPNNKGTYNDVINGLKLYQKIYNQETVFVKAVLAPNNSQYLINTLQTMNEYPFRFDYTIDKENHWTENDLINFKNNLYHAADYYIQHFDELPWTDLFIIHLQVYKEHRNHICAAVGQFSQLTIAPDLSLYTCSRFISSDLCIGSIETGLSNQNNITLLTNVTPKHISECLQCDTFQHSNCRFMCPGATYEVNHSLFSTFPNVCQMFKIYLEVCLYVYKHLQYNPKYRECLYVRNF